MEVLAKWALRIAIKQGIEIDEKDRNSILMISCKETRKKSSMYKRSNKSTRIMASVLRSPIRIVAQPLEKCDKKIINTKCYPIKNKALPIKIGQTLQK